MCNVIGHGYSPDEIKRGKRTLHRAEQWRRDNPHVWAFMVAKATDQAERGERVSGRELIEQVRKIDFADVHGHPTRTDNSYSAPFMRWLSFEHPELAERIERRRSVFDVLVLGGFRG